MSGLPPPSYEASNEKAATSPLLGNNPSAPPGPNYPPPVVNQYQQGQPYPQPMQPGYPPPGQPPHPSTQQPYPPQGYAGQPHPPQGYAGQPPMYGTQQGTATTTIVTQPVPIITAVSFGESPVSTICTQCRCQIITATRYEPGGMAWLVFAILFFFGCWLCCCIPFCVTSCQDVFHSCPNCKTQLGVFRRL